MDDPSVDPDNDLPVFSDRCRNRATDSPRIIATGQAVDKTHDPASRSSHNSPISGTHHNTPTESTSLGPQENNNDEDTIRPSLQANKGRGQETTTTGLLEGDPPQEVIPTFSSLPPSFAGPIRNIQYSAIKDRRTLIDQLSKTIPLNEYNLPVFLYRPDLLDPQYFQSIPTPEEAYNIQEMLSNAIVQLHYGQGFPVLPDGMPIWSTLPWEPIEAYNIFTEYLELPGIRSLHLLQGVDAAETIEYFSLNYWNTRVKAFDRFNQAHKARMRLQRVTQTEDAHYLQADRILEKILPRLNNMTDDDINSLEIMEAVNIFEKLSRIQRISAGLPGNGVVDETKQNRRTLSVEADMRKVALLEGETNQTSLEPDDFDFLRDNPDMVDLAQELILKISKPKIIDHE